MTTTTTSGAADLPEALKHAEGLESFAEHLPAYGFDSKPLKEAAATIRRLHALLESEDAAHCNTISQRDEAEKLGTMLASAVAEHFRVEVGEYSNLNDPRLVALEILGGGYVTDSDTDRKLAALAAGQATAAKQAPECPSMPETWHVVAHVLGEPILSIGYDWLSGKGELTEAETQAVIGMAQHMLAFVGYGLPPSSFDPDADEATAAQQPGTAYAALPEPDSYLFQHEDTGLSQYVDSQQVDWGFEKNNPRWKRCNGTFSESQMRAFADATCAIRAPHGQAPAQQPATSPAPAVDEQSAFEDWLTRKCPPGDAESVQRRWVTSSEYRDWLAQADSQPAPVVGTIAHVGTGKTTLTGAITSALRAARAQADSVTAPAAGAVAGPTSGLHPEKCPITGRPFFMTLDHPELGRVPTYDGPYDSYTIPAPEGEPTDPWHERELRSERYDHDAGRWVEGGEPIPLRIVHEDVLFKLQEGAEAAAAPTPPAPTADSVLEDTARLKEAAGLLEELAEHDSYSTEYDGRMISLCPECGEQEGEHRPNCAFVRAKTFLAARKQGANHD